MGIETTVISREGWDSYFMRFAELAAIRSTCLRRKVGAVIVKNRHILATGYNGAPSGIRHCSEVGCLREQLSILSGERHELCRGTHAEQNAICQAAKHGVSIDGADIYITHSPCSICLKMLINVGVNNIYVKHLYTDDLSEQLYKESGNIKIIKM